MPSPVRAAGDTLVTRYCSRCHFPVAPNAQFCANCGAALIAPVGAPATGPAPTYVPPPTTVLQGAPLDYDVSTPGGEDHPTGAGVLTIIGGLFILLGGIAEMTIGSAVSAVSLGQAGGILAGLGALGILMGILILIFGIVILVSVDTPLGCGIAVIIFAVISLASFLGGFVIGFILALIGGILAITWEPYEPLR